MREFNRMESWQVAKILVVEDEPGIAFALENDLQAEGYKIALATDGLVGSGAFGPPLRAGALRGGDAVGVTIPSWGSVRLWGGLDDHSDADCLEVLRELGELLHQPT